MLSVLKNMSDCTGCYTCFNVCPTNAISMINDDDGFIISNINHFLCIDCNKCIKVCPVYKYTKPHNSIVESFAVYSDDDIRLKSSSGGVFFQLASYFIKENGYVCGAVFKDDFCGVKHIVTNDIAEIYKMMGSKYIQSDMGTVYLQIKKLLLSGKKVLFTGVPCQVAGLNKYLNKKYNNLLTIDIMCHGVPSEFLWRKYLKESNIDIKSISNISFRDKTNGWNYNLILKFSFINGKEYSISCNDDLYFKAFLSGISLRESCFKCNFTNIYREGDLTIGDFWGVDIFHKEVNDDKGISFVTINNKKASDYFKNIKINFVKVINTDINKIKVGNHGFFKSNDKHKGRDIFFNNLKTNSMFNSLKTAYEYKYDCAIFNYWWGNNYGGTLTAFALQKKLEELGFSSVLIHHCTLKSYAELEEHYYNKLSYKFAKKYLKFSRPYFDEEDLRTLNNEIQIFIVGSDQIWRSAFGGVNEYPMFYLKYTNYDKKKIAISASFGTDKFDGQMEYKEIKRLLSRFDHISVREDSGVFICKNDLNIDATHIIDPVFLIDRQYYEDIADEYMGSNKGGFLAYYVFPEVDINIVNKIFSKINIDNKINIDEVNNIEYFLYCYKNADFILTDSFHGMCFAIIFNKPFIVITNQLRGEERFNSILKSLNIDLKILVKSINDVDDALEISRYLNYDLINEKISKLRHFADNWICNSLENDNIKSIKNYIGILENQIIFQSKFSIVKYYKYKLLSKITIGKIRKKYKKKYLEYKNRFYSLRGI